MTGSPHLKTHSLEGMTIRKAKDIMDHKGCHSPASIKNARMYLFRKDKLEREEA
mgnify:CR=1 FL=1